MQPDDDVPESLRVPMRALSTAASADRLARFLSVLVGALITSGTAFAQPSVDAAIRDWVSQYAGTPGVRVLWVYFAPANAPGGTGERQYLAESLTACWGEGIQLRTLGLGPNDDLGSESIKQAMIHSSIKALTWSGEVTELSRDPAGGGRSALRRSAVDMHEHIRFWLHHSEYLCAEYLLSHAPSTDLSTSHWTDEQTERRLRYADDRVEFEWAPIGEDIELVGITVLRPAGGAMFRVELQDRSPDADGAMTARTKRVWAPSGGDEWELSYVARLVEHELLPEVPHDLTELDTSSAGILDLKNGVLLDEEGNRIGTLVHPDSGAGLQWTTVGGVIGAGLLVGGGVWWWMRRRRLA